MGAFYDRHKDVLPSCRVVVFDHHITNDGYGTTNYIDSLNPFNYIESQAVNAMIMIYPQLVAYKYGAEGYQITGDWAKSWTQSHGGKVWTRSEPVSCIPRSWRRSRG